jgi:hypothetical protein
MVSTVSLGADAFSVARQSSWPVLSVWVQVPSVLRGRVHGQYCQFGCRCLQRCEAEFKEREEHRATTSVI